MTQEKPMHAFDWTIEQSAHIHQDRWISLRVDRCRMPDGTSVDPYYVLEFPTWINIVAVTETHEIILIKQYRHGIQRTILELPCGCVDPEDASPLEAAKRELLEETGYSSEHFVQTGILAPNPARQDNFTHCFFARSVRQVQAPALDETEQLETIRMPVKKLLHLVQKGEFVQSLHIASLFLALQQMDNVIHPTTC